MNSYLKYIRQLSRISHAIQSCKNPSVPVQRTNKEQGASNVLIFAPHPDDESIIGALPLRLLREAQMCVTAVAVTLGSNQLRRKQRFNEMKCACSLLGFSLLEIDSDGLSNINLQSRNKQPDTWQISVKKIEDVLVKYSPAAIFIPHADDGNSTHIGVHYLVVDALKALGSRTVCLVVETEYWRAMKKPNLLVESSESDVAELVAATAMHFGEVQRNPYHALLPAWMQDNIRRGAELVGIQGDCAPHFRFGTLYRVRKWNSGQFTNAYRGKRQISINDRPDHGIGLNGE